MDHAVHSRQEVAKKRAIVCYRAYAFESFRGMNLSERWFTKAFEIHNISEYIGTVQWLAIINPQSIPCPELCLSQKVRTAMRTYPGGKLSALSVWIEAVLSVIIVIRIVKFAGPSLGLPSFEFLFVLI